MMKSFFQSYDKNGDGVLSKAEMKEVMVKMGAPVGGSILDAMLADVDVNKDGKISYEGKLKEPCHVAINTPVTPKYTFPWYLTIVVFTCFGR